ncbi:universal stress protein [Amycolatopsis sp. CA-230715]|uniref:universal stress protein n=1 Tax=Amycolatopsis sp. CA-230715 TaxID=2745196 RepID=UPI001C00F0AB|nr:universal stress protein [Amycolatopsis sp. CA-230715]QWF78000.1 Universal stress protein [Amycolatopsis sp. CA-230715]QWF85934.1 Universal stress protein [Amycolatopsis sp. CA-230715]
MNKPSQNFPVVVAVVLGERNEPALRWAAAEAGRRGAPVRIFTAYGYEDVAPGASFPPPTEWLAMKKVAADELLRESAAIVGDEAPSVDITTEAVSVGPVKALLDLSRRARMVVLGEPNSAVAALLEGSVSVSLAARARCPVVVVRGAVRDGSVVVGVDGSPTSESALAHAFEAASFAHAPLVALHTWHDGDSAGLFSEARMYFEWEPVEKAERRLLAERLAGWAEKYPDVRVDRVVVQDKPRHNLLDWSKRARLVVVGSRGRGGFSGLLLGSTSQAVLHHAHCPVMIVPANPR